MALPLDRSILRERLFAILSAFFGILALLLAGVGLYGLMAYKVTRRTQEIGVHIALGAARKNVLSMILCETLGLTSIGIALGLACALAASRPPHASSRSSPSVLNDFSSLTGEQVTHWAEALALAVVVEEAM